MKSICKIMSNLIMIAYGVTCMPLLIFVAIFFPIMNIVDAFTIISTGYTVYGDYISLIMAISMLMYLSLRFRALRRIYVIFPSLFETLKYLIIAGIFTGIGVEILNWSHIILTPGRKMLGIGMFILSLVLWRLFVSIYYRKKPLSKIMLESSEKMQNYNEELI